MTAAEDGLVLLVQKRLAANDALYIAIRATGGLKIAKTATRALRRPRLVNTRHHPRVLPSLSLAA
jgi:hypothetical protein